MELWNKKFENYWQLFSENMGLGAERSNLIYQILQHAYMEPHRYYHTVQHIVECLDLYKEVKELLENPLWVELAIWFHDVVYDPKSNENEGRSALLMQELCEDFLDDEAVETVFLWIIATKHHQATNQLDLTYLLDIDLAILGMSCKRFSMYEQQIRQEYAWVPIEIYKVKRMEVLQQFKHQSPLYQTAYFQEKLEKQAVLNLKSVLDSQ